MLFRVDCRTRNHKNLPLTPTPNLCRARAASRNLRPLQPRQHGDIDGDAPRFVVNYQLMT